MLAVAAAGYMFFGPDSEIARGDHEKPARAVNRAAAPAAPPSVVLAVSATFTADELATIEAEMDAINHELDSVFGGAPSQTASVTGTKPMLDTTRATHNNLSSAVNNLLQAAGATAVPGVEGD
jgi:hypothetical protein